MKIFIAPIVFSLLVSGCSFLSVKTFQASDLGGATDNKTLVSLHDTADCVVPEFSKEEPNLFGQKTITVAPVATAVLAAVGRLAFTSYTDERIRNLESLKKAAEKTFTGRLIVDANEFSRKNCLEIIRYSGNCQVGDLTNEQCNFGLLVRLHIEHKTGAFVFEPIYIRARNTVAKTKEPPAGEPAKVNVSVAVAIKTTYNDRTGLPKLGATGEGVVSIAKVDVSRDDKTRPHCLGMRDESTDHRCPSSDLIPYVTNSGQYLSVNVGITETGIIGFDIDEEISRAKTLAAVLGPAIESGLKEQLKDD